MWPQHSWYILHTFERAAFVGVGVGGVIQNAQMPGYLWHTRRGHAMSKVPLNVVQDAAQQQGASSPVKELPPCGCNTA